MNATTHNPQNVREGFIHIPRNFDTHTYGARALVAALRECADNPNTVAAFVVAEHPQFGERIYKRVVVGYEVREVEREDGFTELEMSWRFAGEKDKLDGFGSHALIATWERDQSVEAAAAELALRLGAECGLHRGPGFFAGIDRCACIFRVPVEARMPQAAEALERAA